MTVLTEISFSTFRPGIDPEKCQAYCNAEYNFFFNLCQVRTAVYGTLQLGQSYLRMWLVLRLLHLSQSILTKSRSSCFESARYAKDACFDACVPTFRRRLQNVHDIKRTFKEGFEQAMANATTSKSRSKRAKKFYFW